MQKRLYFICPTDGLEACIDRTFRHENYYFTSLGNSLVFNAETVNEINELIETKNIEEVTFVLSDNNRLIIDALKNKEFTQISALNRFYKNLEMQKNLSNILWYESDFMVPILSHYLNSKMIEIQPYLYDWLVDRVKLTGKIFYRQKNIFREIQPDLYNWGCYILN